MMAPPPFVVFSLPRSRSFWLSRWLGAVAQAPVGHDLAVEAGGVDDWLETVFRRVRGTVETGAVEAWPILRSAIPDCRVAVVRRPLADVVASLQRLGAPVPWGDLERRDHALADLAAQPGVLAVDFRALFDPKVCARLQLFCLAAPFDFGLWAVYDALNLQVDWPERRTRLIERAEPLARLKQEMAERLADPRPFVTIGEEAWAHVADAVIEMAATHHDEATLGREGAFLANREALEHAANAGLWRMVIARVDGALAGYCGWTRQVSLESDLPPAMEHGPFYVAPQHARHRLGRRLLAASRDLFAAEGVRLLTLHHTVHGRGERAARLYASMGAEEYRRDYLWTIGGDHA